MHRIPLVNLSILHQDLKKEILNSWSQIIDENSYTSGKETEQFQQQFAQLAGCKYALGVRSGTAALVVALKALGIGSGDEVITTPMTFTATADAIVLCGAKPIFVDVLAETGNIDPQLIEAKITSQTKAILVVHLYGVPCEMAAIKKIARRYRLKIIEDASHAHGSLYRQQPVGSWGDIACFSLYPSKTLGALGNAGIITTNQTKLITQVKMFAHHGINKPQQKYKHFVSGFNELMDNIQAAALLIKMKTLPSRIAQKLAIANRYNQFFQSVGHPGMIWPNDVNPSLYVYAVQLKSRAKFQEMMTAKNIETGIYYPIPLHLQPSFKQLNYHQGSLPVAEKFAQQTISLPLYPELTDEEINYIGQSITAFLA